jgi:hypothetical protein
VAAWVLLGDCALETFVSGWRGRWIVLLIVTAYLGGILLIRRVRPGLWRRVGWVAKAKGGIEHHNALQNLWNDMVDAAIPCEEVEREANRIFAAS